MSFKIVETRLAAEVAAAATVNVAYPTGTNAGTFKGAVGHKMMLGEVLLSSPADFTLAFGAANITVTNAYGSAWASGSRVWLELQIAGGADIPLVNKTSAATLALVNLGAPLAASAAGLAAAQTPAAAGDLVLAADSLDVPRNITETGVAATVAHTLTVTGVDEYDEAVVETITGAVGATTVSGKKAFKSITSIAVSGATTGAITVGWGDVLGLPVFLQEEAMVLKEIEDDAAAAAGTLLAGVVTEPSATTGDVRGTYDPSSACNGAKVFRLVATLADPTYKGLTQYAG